jgi:hypothetical protein
MRLDGKTNRFFALIVFNGEAEIAEVKKKIRGFGYVVQTRIGHIFPGDYDEKLDLHPTDDHNPEMIHVVAVADTAAKLPRPETLALPSKTELDAALPAIREEIKAAGISQEMKDHLGRLLAGKNAVAVGYPFLADSPNAVEAIKRAVNKKTSWEKRVFAGVSAEVKKTVDTVARVDPREQNRENFMQRVRETAGAEVQRNATTNAGHKVAQVVDPDEFEKSCKAELQKVLAEAMQKIGEIDRTLLANRQVPAWRDGMNEVFETAMAFSRALDYDFKEPAQTPARRR